MSKANEALDRMAENARELGIQMQPAQQKPVPLRDAIVGNLVREGINKHRARELADHFINLTNAQPTVPDALTAADKESPDYTDGWNDCRQAMLAS